MKIMIAVLLALTFSIPAVAEGGSDRAEDLYTELLKYDVGLVEAALSGERLETCLETVAEARGWPAAWLIVQDQSVERDLVILLRQDEDETSIEPVTVFAADRREWDADRLKAAIRRETGRKPAAKIRNIVIQGFSSREVTEYVHALPPAGAERRGLLALLPERSLIREARKVDLGDGRLHTLGLALIEPEFLPADCDSCAGRDFGHADTGGVLVVLAGEQELEDSIDLTGRLHAHGGRPLIPRFACEVGDDLQTLDASVIGSWIRERTQVRILELRDLDGDGRALEFELPAEYEDCGIPVFLTVAVDPRGPALRILD
jgi:hypothetical protein